MTTPKLEEKVGKMKIIDGVKESVCMKSKNLEYNTPVKGADMAAVCETPQSWDGPDRLSQILSSFRTTGFQATNLSLAIDEVNRMRTWRSEDGEPCKIFLGYTSNQVSCGNREVIHFLVKNKMIDCIVTTAGGIEEDFIKCMKPTVLGDFALDGRRLRKDGMNRIGNLLVPNDNYCAFEDWLTPLLNQMCREQNEKKEGASEWTPSKMIRFLGKKIDSEESIYYWAAMNDIPVFCPALTDGSIGDMIYFHSYSQEEGCALRLDICHDIRLLNDLAVRAPSTGIICLGGGLVKHHICNANLMRNGAEFAVFINTGQEFDGSDSGASPEEALSWGKLKANSRPVKVNCEATIAFPLLVAETFGTEGLEARKIRLRECSHELYL